MTPTGRARGLAVTVGLPIAAGILFGLLTTTILIVVGTIPAGPPAVIMGIAMAVVFGLLMGFTLGRARPTTGGRRGVRRLGRALKSGHAPPDAPVEEWLGHLDSRERVTRPLRWAGPAVFGVIGILSLVVLFADPGHSAVQWVFAPLFLCLAAFYPIWARRSLTKIGRLRADLYARRGRVRDVGDA